MSFTAPIKFQPDLKTILKTLIFTPMKQEISLATIERGFAEMQVLSSISILERATGTKFQASCWYSKKTAGWNVSLRNQQSEPTTVQGLGRDFHDACQQLVNSTLLYLSDFLGEDFQSFFEVEKFLDNREGLQRNEVGALDKDEITEIREMLQLLMKRIDGLAV